MPVTYTPSSGGVLGSMFSASGAFDLQIKLQPHTPWGPVRYFLTLWNASAINWDSGRLHLDWQTVGTDPSSAANAVVVWTTPISEGFWKRRVIDVSVWTVPETASKFVQFHAETGGTVSAWFLLDGKDYNSSGYIQSNHTQWHGNISYNSEQSELSDSVLNPDNVLIKGHGSVDGMTSGHAEVDVWTDGSQGPHHLDMNMTHRTFIWDVKAKWSTYPEFNVGLLLPFPATSCKA